jgi:hypothetical protein
VSFNNRRKDFSVRLGARTLRYPYARLQVPPSADDPVVSVAPDPEVGHQGFTYTQASGAEGVVLSDQVLDYNEDPRYQRDALLYEVTLQAQERLRSSRLSRREIIRRLGTSPAQFYRLLDQTNTRKTMDKMLALLHVLDCEVTLSVRPARRCARSEINPGLISGREGKSIRD